jgi:hypothetical protein
LVRKQKSTLHLPVFGAGGDGKYSDYTTTLTASTDIRARRETATSLQRSNSEEND